MFLLRFSRVIVQCFSKFILCRQSSHKFYLITTESKIKSRLVQVLVVFQKVVDVVVFQMGVVLVVYWMVLDVVAILKGLVLEAIQMVVDVVVFG